MPGGSTSGGRGFWADALRAALDAAASKYASGRPADVPPPPKPAPGEQPRQQTAPPLTAEQRDLLNRVNNKLNAQAQAKPGQQAGVPPGALPGQDKPGGQQQQTVPQGDPEQRGLPRKILESISKAITAPMDFARRGIEKLDRIIEEPDEAIEEGRQQGGVRGRLKAGFAGVVKGLGQQSSLQGISSISGAAGDVAGAVPFGLGKPAESFFKLNEVVLKSVDRLRKWSDQLHEGNVRFAEFSGRMLAVQKEMEAREIQLSSQKGEALADSARDLARAKAERENQMFNIDVAWQKLQNRIGTVLERGFGRFLKATPFGRQALPDLGPTMHEWMQDVTENESNRPGSLIPPPKRWGPGA